MGKIPISVVVITKNEEANIADCLKSVEWADEIIVLDDYSTDETVSIAKQFTDRVFSRKMDVEGIHRNYAYSLAKNNWVLSLDADERASVALGDELKILFAKPINDEKGFAIPSRTYLGKKWIAHGGWYPQAKLKLFDKRLFKYEEVEVHPRGFLFGNCGRLKNDIIHYSYRNYHDFFGRLNNQTTLEAKKWFNERRKIGFFKMYRKFIDRFLKSFVLKRGYKDGFLGFVVAYGNGLYQLMSYAKYREMLNAEIEKPNYRPQAVDHGSANNSSEKLKISVVVITKNEEENIARCLASVKWADEVILVDDFSIDNTVNIAKQFTEKVYSRKMDIEGVHRNYAYSLARNNVVLSLDADEMASAELEGELRTLMKRPLRYNAYTIPIRTYLGNMWIKHCGWYPAAKVRLFDKRFFKYEEAEVHPRVFIVGKKSGHLKKDIIHYSYKDFHDYFESLNNQTTLEAKKWFNELRRINLLGLYRKFLHRFVKSYILRAGYLDGLVGFVFSFGGGLYQFMSYVKYREMLEETCKS